ncbi:orotidine-5'-phosphate decarboxylase [Tenuibacillus multivorans]|uniref:Orotidine 5'-phosphate decarboxylase n=1 Tax=Tenuibacillus multivorans TaxID=237069 RepID=A0A1G9Y5N8_9BACI|nr:orotidine-5'-phosphate decarboxylase [Tenuibacillus multivorans]GEL75940.1 orotidine 5'-phosphate decarboxylase [Tenuibacillus multivorans]SDN03785.1 orotidine-5'-phosphate decarboxylase [Tenuibacillus multivorans]
MTPPIFIALDFTTEEEAIHFLDRNGLNGVPVKVGMQLFYREGPKLIERLKERDHSIFLDLKLHDIPNTVHQAMKNLARLEVDFVNVHAAGGRRMMEAARQGLEEVTNGHRPRLLAVTQLTSTDQDMLNQELLIDKPIDDVVKSYAKLAQKGGADGVVCSVYEAEQIKQIFEDDFLTVTPGIRLLGDENHDQKRVATPAIAKQKQADYLVIGRSITKVKNPKQAYNRAVKEWNHESSETIN